MVNSLSEAAIVTVNGIRTCSPGHTTDRDGTDAGVTVAPEDAFRARETLRTRVEPLSTNASTPVRRNGSDPTASQVSDTEVFGLASRSAWRRARTRYSATPWAGTSVEIVPVDSDLSWLHRSCSE